ncbi:MAG: HIT domain-containing protein [Pseudomonadota bacterium]
MKFIEELRLKGTGCLFCELALEGDDGKRLILHRGKLCYAVMNRFPYNNGHLMIVPYKHTGSLAELSDEENAEMMRICSESVRIMQKALEAEGFNCGFNIGAVAGAGIKEHIHLHVVPRWCGDANFLPIIGDTRSMPEYLEDTYNRLIGEFKKIE